MKFRELPKGERSRVKAFYDLTTYRRPISDLDRVFVAEHGENICGAVRIESREGIQVLRGMYIHPNMTQQGIGTDLLEYIEPALAETDSYCIPGEHLFDFYGKIRFAPIAVESAPGFLAARVKGYLEEGKAVGIMYRVRG